MEAFVLESERINRIFKSQISTLWSTCSFDGRWNLDGDGHFWDQFLIFFVFGCRIIQISIETAVFFKNWCWAELNWLEVKFGMAAAIGLIRVWNFQTVEWFRWEFHLNEINWSWFWIISFNCKWNFRWRLQFARFEYKFD